jgi:hypothetical protein
MYENLQSINMILIVIAAILATIFSIKALLFIKSQEKDYSVKKMLIWVVGLLAVGNIIWAIAETAWNIQTVFFQEFEYSAIADPLYVIGYIPILAAFLYFNYHLYKSHKETADIIYIIVASLAVATSVYFIIRAYIMPSLSEGSAILAFLNLYYPIGSSLILITIIPILFFFKKAKIHAALLLIAISFFFTFIGDMVWAYWSWNSMEYGVVGALSDFCYVLEYSFAAIGFYLFSRKSSKLPESD